MRREVIYREKWLRLVKYDRGFEPSNTYAVQVRWWFVWWNVCFGPYFPMSLGLIEFHNYHIALHEYSKCLTMKKSYTLNGRVNR